MEEARRQNEIIKQEQLRNLRMKQIREEQAYQQKAKQTRERNQYYGYQNKVHPMMKEQPEIYQPQNFQRVRS